jgi:acyl-coenzyme A thioesterase PaaI-like protein
VTAGEIIAEATVERRKPSVFLGEAVVRDGSNQVVAKASAMFMVMDHPVQDE